ncbi:TlpA family protein disulfide reductase [Microvenator marinus]|jgi:peroxiredoxin|uniref:TlpA family protein disulfide reductase n=1 Tax=Microvenator marinus TaxID=2600177 RepID=A0A5B8XQX6_9DELT|nr:TlpA disulfide reductase family protein [Microvenator marinus]QED26433.1 TlpA family protein disulfide reductase [Microvenator marinus]
MKFFHVQILLIVALVSTGGYLASKSWSLDESPAVMSAIEKLGGEWVGRPAPNFELQGIDGKTHRLADYRGQVIFLNFWASFCEPCREEMPSMENLVRQYADQGMVMVAISHDQKLEDMTGFMNQFLPGERSAMTLLWDPEVGTAPRYGTELIPETYIIDRQGRIVARFVSAYDWTRPEVKQLIEALIRSESNRMF